MSLGQLESLAKVHPVSILLLEGDAVTKQVITQWVKHEQALATLNRT